MKRSKVKILSLMLVIIFVFSALATSTGAAEAFLKAVKPSYELTINGEKIAATDETVMNIGGRTYLQMHLLKNYGVDSIWDGSEAHFTIPQAGDTIVTNTTSAFDYSKVTANQVKFYKKDGNGGWTFIGNGVFCNKYFILTPRWIWNHGHGSLKAVDHKGNRITIKANPIKTSPRLTLLRTIGYAKAEFAELATEAPEVGDNIALAGSIDQVSNYINFSTVKNPEFSYNWLTTGDKDYMRSYNQCSNTSIGSGMYDDEGKLVGIFGFKAHGYAVSITLKDIKDFL